MVVIQLGRQAIIYLLMSLVPISGTAQTDYQDALKHDAALSAQDLYTLQGERHFVSGYPALNSDGTINVIIEIPAGSSAKWEVSKKDGMLRWEFKKGKPRVVKYLAYPFNYGMVPGTILPKAVGGDGDPLDVLVLGPAVPRGSLIKAKIIGLLRMKDKGKRDDKIIAVMPGNELYELDSIREMNRRYKGMGDILKIWLSNYKGPKKIKSKGFAEKPAAIKILTVAMARYSEVMDNKQAYGTQ